MADRTIQWEEKPFASGWEAFEPDAVVWVDVSSFDASWRRTVQYIVPGGENGQDRRYHKVGEWFSAND